jgi:predicted Zn-dependent peptidase
MWKGCATFRILRRLRGFAECAAGIAHLLEHMAFKGSTNIGTKNYRDEVLLLQELDDGVVSQ